MKKQLIRSLLAVITALTLVVSQAAALQHTHEGDLQTQFDCQLCHKLGSSEDGLPSTALVIGHATQLHRYVQPDFTAQPGPQPAAIARAPPRFLA
ncbi:MAG: hypothetical protein RLZZ385_1827 [Pseudomonadota bacterium]|jgi:hypothetical protein